MDIGYARVSTDDQKMDLQIDALIKAGVEPDWIYQEKTSGKHSARPALDECLKCLRKGDTLVVYKLDRLGRSLRDLADIIERLEKHNIGFRSLTEAIDTTTAGGRLIFHMFGAVAQFERDVIVERTMAGLAAAKRRGRKGGRRPKLKPKQVETARKLLSDDPSHNMASVAALLSVSRATLYRAIARAEAEEWAARKATEEQET